jgi:hypothetical protein
MIFPFRYPPSRTSYYDLFILIKLTSWPTGGWAGRSSGVSFRGGRVVRLALRRQTELACGETGLPHVSRLGVGSGIGHAQKSETILRLWRSAPGPPVRGSLKTCGAPTALEFLPVLFPSACALG